MKNLDQYTTEQLEPFAKEWLRRVRAASPSRKKVERPCSWCGLNFGARDLRKHLPTCTMKEAKVQ